YWEASMPPRSLSQLAQRERYSSVFFTATLYLLIRLSWQFHHGQTAKSRLGLFSLLPIIEM
ncbi:MAG: hypothetical protein LBH18_06335, partial [Spirochaetaceae bacterium]|nr:hypothetical protein [Spirochaetaceae bacterium]